MSGEDWEEELVGAVSSMAMGYAAANPNQSGSGSIGRGRWFEPAADKKPGSNSVANNDQWAPSVNSFNGNESDSNRGGGNSGQSSQWQDNERHSGNSNGYRGGGSGRSFGDRRGGGFGSGYNRSSDGTGGNFGSRDSGGRGGRGESGSFRRFENSADGDESSSGFGGGRNYRRGGDDGDQRGRGGFGRGGGRGGGHQDNADNEGEERPKPYIPPSAPEDEESVFSTIKSGINFSKYSEIEVKVTGENVPPCIHSFESSGLRMHLVQNVRKSTYTTPTPVQKYAIPIIAAGRDLMACAQTGSGKTAAFLLPIMDNIMENPESVAYKEVQEPYALIVAPTRELAFQIFNEALKFSHGSVIKCVVAYGGVSLRYCIQQVESGCHVLVGTPGRLVDIINRGKVVLNKLRYFVLDEADRLLDKQFRLDVDKVIKHPTMPSKIHTLMFSATFEEDVQHFAATILDNYLFLAVGTIGGANVDVEQNFIKVEKFEKKNQLINILVPDEKVLVFIERKRNADFVASILSQKGFPTTSIHGDRFQAQREEALRDFRTGKMMALVATSLASRGLDINEVAHVINYDLPSDIDDYVHRIGRTGRVGNPGKATSFYDPGQDQALARPLVKMLKEAKKPVPDWLDEEAGHAVTSSQGFGGGGRFGSRDIRNPSNFNGGSFQSAADHWEPGGNTSSSGPNAAITEEESWD